MKSGKELDALVAEHVMGWDRVHCYSGGNLYFGRPDDDYRRDFPNAIYEKRILAYSTDIAAAWEVVEQMVNMGYSVSVDYVGVWRCFMTQGGFGKLPVEAATAPLAICLAALKAMGVEVKDD